VPIRIIYHKDALNGWLNKLLRHRLLNGKNTGTKRYLDFKEIEILLLTFLIGPKESILKKAGKNYNKE